MIEPTKFLTDEKGERIAVVISIEEYKKIVEELEELADIKAYDEAKASGETPIPLEEALADIRRVRNQK
jgi:hypothetical protein